MRLPPVGDHLNNQAAFALRAVARGLERPQVAAGLVGQFGVSAEFIAAAIAVGVVHARIVVLG